MRRILVTGASGLVGTALTQLDGMEWIPVSSKDADLRDPLQVESLFRRNLPLDGVIHLAANVGGVFKNMSQAVEMYEDNIIMNTNILRVAHAFGVQRVLCYLSTCIFPDVPPAYPITTEMLHTGPPHHSNEGYAYAKRMVEVHCRLYQKQYGREYFCVVPTNIYGPRDNFNLENAHVMPALIHKCWLAKRDGTPFSVAGDGTPLRQFIYSDDIARLTLWAFERYKDISNPMILCPPKSEVPLSYVVELITKAYNFGGPVVYDTTRTNGQLKKTTAHTIPPEGFEFTSLESGIQKTVEWFNNFKNKYTEISHCRICESTNLYEVLNLGNQVIASRFPAKDEADPPSAPLVLLQCKGECGLLQLKHTVHPDEMYKHTYGYRSGINETMRNHLKTIVNEMQDYIVLEKSDTVVDIGSNDGTLLSHYPDFVDKIGIDPTGAQFLKYYPTHVKLVPDFFTIDTYKKNIGDKKAKCVTSISMFYDLPKPLQFMKDVSEILDKDGIWIMEQSYALTMFDMNSFDTICHEHLEYYILTQIHWMCQKTGLRIINVTLNDCNGGSFRVVIGHASFSHQTHENVQIMLHNEQSISPSIITDFQSRCVDQKQKLTNLLKDLKNQGKNVCLYGASTKGNTLLQYYGITSDSITCAAERNMDKVGCRTPVTNIPIESEETVRQMKPDYMLVLPWHFKNEFLVREKEYIQNGGHFIFPLPEVEVV
jgi:nucleoside-diphosphate-sugar epimerase